MQLKADLHTHSTYSDGALSIKQLLDLAYEKNIRIISITDHDTIDGIEEAINYGREIGVEVIPGLEISTDVEGKEIHLLGYFIDYKNIQLIEYLEYFKNERVERAKRILDKLGNLGIDIEFNQILEIANNSPICRPHIAQAMVTNNSVKNFTSAFYNYLGDYAPAFEKKNNITSDKAINLINNSGGLAFIAHPGKMKETILKELIDQGIDGIEVIHPSHKKSQQKFYKGIVNQYCLLDSGGSDFHSGFRNDNDNFGKYYTSQSTVENIKKMVLSKQTT